MPQPDNSLRGCPKWLTQRYTQNNITVHFKICLVVISCWVIEWFFHCPVDVSPLGVLPRKSLCLLLCSWYYLMFIVNGVYLFASVAQQVVSEHGVRAWTCVRCVITNLVVAPKWWIRKDGRWDKKPKWWTKTTSISKGLVVTQIEAIFTWVVKAKTTRGRPRSTPDRRDQTKSPDQIR
jgi:hypothetical protein